MARVAFLNSGDVARRPFFWTFALIEVQSRPSVESDLEQKSGVQYVLAIKLSSYRSISILTLFT